MSLAACAGAFVALYLLGEQLLGAAGASRSVLYLAIFPMALFLGAVYTESLYLFLSIAGFLLATRGRFLWAAVAIGLAMLTRSTGVMLLPAVAVLAWRADDRSRSLLSLAVAPLIAALWPLWLWVRLGDPLIFLDAQRNGWAASCRPTGRSAVSGGGSRLRGRACGS